jgi:hypothetical protein
MRRFILGWKRLGLEARFGAQVVNYADDMVICCKHGAEEALQSLRQLKRRLKLTVDEEKTQICQIPRERFDFLGYTFGLSYSPKTGRRYVSPRPSKKSIRSVIEEIHEQTKQRALLYRAIDVYTAARLRRWLCRKHKKRTGDNTCYPHKYLYQQLGLVCLLKRERRLLWAKA